MSNDTDTRDSRRGSRQDLRWAALAGVLLVLPFAVLEARTSTITEQNASGLIVLFGLLWLLAAVFVVVLTAIVRHAWFGRDTPTRLVSVGVRVAVLAVIAAVWVSIVVDQMPCFLGIANCD